jgi:hypothetical protein
MLRPAPTHRLLAAAAILAGVLCVPAVAPANDADGVRSYLYLARKHESTRGCALSPSTSSAIGYYQMTLAALRDIRLKDDMGNWIENEWGITSDEEFQCNLHANDEAMKRYTEINWSILNGQVKERIGNSAYGVLIDAASLLAGAHFLGARGMNEFILCGMHVTCIAESAVQTNGGDGAAIHRRLIARMKEAAGLNLSELTDGS